MFIEILASKSSKTKRKNLYGIGVNDADYIVNQVVCGKIVTCPFYKRWKNMMERCYSKSMHIRKPSCKGSSVCDEWLTFSNFKRWMINQDWQGKHLDKDIVKTGNKIYSPRTCIFVTQEINKLLIYSPSCTGKYPQGVTLSKDGIKLQAGCRVNGIRKGLGLFDNPESASKAYKKFKSKLILSVAEKQDQPLKGYLIRIAGEFQS